MRVHRWEDSCLGANGDVVDACVCGKVFSQYDYGSVTFEDSEVTCKQCLKEMKKVEVKP